MLSKTSTPSIILKWYCGIRWERGRAECEAAISRWRPPLFKALRRSETGLGLSMVHGFAEQSGGRLILRGQKDGARLLTLVTGRQGFRATG